MAVKNIAEHVGRRVAIERKPSSMSAGGIFIGVLEQDALIDCQFNLWGDDDTLTLFFNPTDGLTASIEAIW